MKRICALYITIQCVCAIGGGAVDIYQPTKNTLFDSGNGKTLSVPPQCAGTNMCNKVRRDKDHLYCCMLSDNGYLDIHMRTRTPAPIFALWGRAGECVRMGHLI